MHILLLERNYSFPKYMKNAIISDFRCSLVSCSSITVMKQVIGGFSPDIFIMDLDISNVDELKMIEEFKSCNQNIYTLIIIRLGNYEQFNEALTIGVDDFVIEPVEERELMLRIKKAIFYKRSSDLPTRNTSSIDNGAPIYINGDIFQNQKIQIQSQELTQKLLEELQTRAQSDLKIDTQPESKQGVVAFREDQVDLQQEEQSAVFVNVTRRGPAGRKSKKRGLTGNIGKHLANFASVALLIMVLVLAFVLVQGKLMGNVPIVAGYQLYMVISGSMSPTFDTGSLIFVQVTDPSDIYKGDIITFKGSRGGDYLTTHRVVDISNGEELAFITRGDANNVNDPNPVPADNLVGKVRLSIPYLGYVLGFLQTREGLISMVFIPGIVVIALEIRNLLRYSKELSKEKKEKDKGVLSA